MSQLQQQLTMGLCSVCWPPLVTSVLLYPTETWTMLASDLRTLEAFHMKCQSQLLRVKWHHFVQNDQISAVTNILSISSTISRRRNAISSAISPDLTKRSQHTRHCDITSIWCSADSPAASGNVLPAGPAASGLTRSTGTTITPLLQTSGELPSDVVVERRYSPRWLRNDDDDELLAETFAALLSSPARQSCICCCTLSYKFPPDRRLKQNQLPTPGKWPMATVHPLVSYCQHSGLLRVLLLGLLCYTRWYIWLRSLIVISC